MPPFRIPGTDKIIFCSRMNSDMNVDLSEHPDIDTVISQEDKPAVGTYTDSDGTILNTKNSREVMLAGLVNDFDGDLIMKVKKKRMSPLNERGVRTDTHFTKNKVININTGEACNGKSDTD